MFKNVATKIALFAFDVTTGAAKTGDAANLTAYVSKDYGTVTVLADTSATEMDATNAKGWYLFDVAQAETNADALLFTGKSSTANVSVVGQYVHTSPNRFSSLVIDAAGLADANAVKIGPTGSGTAQTARDIGASVLLSSGTGTGQLDFTAGVVKANLAQILGTALTETAGQIAAAFKKFFNIATPASTMDALTLVATATNLTNAPTAGDFTATMKTSIGTAVAASAVASVTGNVGGNVTGSVGSVVGAVGSVTGLTASDVGAIKAKTDNLPSDPADASDIAGAFSTVNTTLGTIAGYIDTEVGAIKTDTAAIKLKTDNLPASPAAVSDIPTGAAISDAVWDEGIAGHAGAGSTGEALAAAAAGGGSPPPTATEIADEILNREFDDADTGGDRTLLQAARFIRNGFSITGATLTVLKEDDTTPAYTRDLTTDAGAIPIVGAS
jgi:hypothetical protein